MEVTTFERVFPVLSPPAGCTKYVRWDALSDDHAIRVHGQTLERLSLRGGLSSNEIACNVLRLRWADPVDLETAIRVTNSIAPNVPK